MPEVCLDYQPDSLRWAHECRYRLHSHLLNLNLFLMLKPSSKHLWVLRCRMLNSLE